MPLLKSTLNWVKVRYKGGQRSVIAVKQNSQCCKSRLLHRLQPTELGFEMQYLAILSMIWQRNFFYILWCKCELWEIVFISHLHHPSSRSTSKSLPLSTLLDPPNRRPENPSPDLKNLNDKSSLTPRTTINQILVREICNFSSAIHKEINIFLNLYQQQPIWKVGAVK